MARSPVLVVVLALGAALVADGAALDVAPPLSRQADFETVDAWSPALRAALRAVASGAAWQARTPALRLTRAVLRSSINLATEHLLSNQTARGNFNYEYDFRRRTLAKGDNPTRQAGALWGLAVLHCDRPTRRTRAALQRGLAFFRSHSTLATDGSLVLAYPRSGRAGTGTVALVALAIVEQLRGDTALPADRREALLQDLTGYLGFLKGQQRPDGTFSAYYILARRKRSMYGSCYSDGEALLAFCKAARYLGRHELISRIQAAAAAMIRSHVLDPWRREVDPVETKQFYQWGTMSFWECYDAGWPNGEACADAALAMSWWMIHAHKTLDRPRNTAYAHEGLVHAYRIAKARRLADATSDLTYAIDTGLHRLIAWQVGGPLSDTNPFLRRHPEHDPIATGGIMNGSDDPVLRIDVAQHQSHAMLLAHRHLYR